MGEDSGSGSFFRQIGGYWSLRYRDVQRQIARFGKRGRTKALC